MQIFFSCQNNQIYLKLTIHFIDCSEKEHYQLFSPVIHIKTRVKFLSWMILEPITTNCVPTCLKTFSKIRIVNFTIFFQNVAKILNITYGILGCLICRNIELIGSETLLSYRVALGRTQKNF